ncbi:PadR family transcriptional regulator [Amycolatopsis nalaikhensis]|uniref:PadR family transcriptional regulator n=1 Tax=Amycolatopsis nalaikhensis TaxID=715472 RepID=A0ABY8XJ41_9PSEU|nr:PadR family transcriptional regulator [Amycolatopsis sp. 2-2]WIV55613.1 PadR family transcriptional regulator [Amycolatopsis sp. 2-2]
MDMSAGRIFAGFGRHGVFGHGGAGHSGHGHGPDGFGVLGGHGLGGQDHGRGEHSHERGGHAHGSGGHGHDLGGLGHGPDPVGHGHTPGEFGALGGHGHGAGSHGPGGFDVPDHEDWDFGPELARGGPPGGFPPHPPHPPQPPGPPGPPGAPGFPGFPGGPGSFGGPGGWFGGGGPWQRVREFRGGGRPAARPVRPAVLALLAEEPMHGYQLMQEIRRRTHDRWRPSPGSIYPILQQLEDEGLVHTAESGGRRVAELTDAGREHVAGREDEFAALWAEPEDEPGADRFAALWHALGELSGAAAQVGYSGTDAQVAEVKKVLADARRKVYAVLADAELEDEDS